MTEVVTNTAASLQQTLVAESRSRAFSASSNADTNSNETPVAVRPTGKSGADAVARPAKPDQSHADDRRQQQPAPDQKIKRVVPDPADTDRASRSESRGEAVKVELKDFDLGRRPAEVVGTADVVQRFDNNLDGRVDLLESQRAVRARDTSSTFSARGGAISETPSVAEQIQDREIAQSIAPPPQAPTAPQPAPAAQAGQSAEQGAPPKKIFDDAQVVSGGTAEDGTVPEKIFGSEAVASQGTYSDGAPVDQKFFGDGAEVVVGRFAQDPDVSQKLSDKAGPAEPGRFYEDGTGEQKLYDKVAQTEAGRFYDEDGQRKLYDEADLPRSGETTQDGQPAEQSLYEKAQQVEAQTGTAEPAAEQPKKLYGELELYADVAGLGEETIEVPVSGVGPVTA